MSGSRESWLVGAVWVSLAVLALLICLPMAARLGEQFRQRAAKAGPKAGSSPV